MIRLHVAACGAREMQSDLQATPFGDANWIRCCVDGVGIDEYGAEVGSALNRTLQRADSVRNELMYISVLASAL